TREQAMCLYVPYRSCATPTRNFIIADTPGHLQYTRNMVTGASTADLAVVLVDARKGVLAHPRRHACISSLRGIRHLPIAVNKIDLVDYSEERFDEIVRDFCEFRGELASPDIRFFPISA